MHPVLARVRRSMRDRSWLALALVIGIFGGIVIAAAAGARRTDSAYPRFLQSQRAYQQFMFTFPLYPGTAFISAEQLRTLPEVDAVVEGMMFGGPSVTLRGSLDPRLDTTLNAVNVLEGRLPTAADELLLPPLFAEEKGLEVGDTFTIPLQAGPDPDSPTVNVETRVVGIGVAPGEFPPENDIGVTHWVHVAPAFVETYAHTGGPFAYVFLKRADADLESFQRGLSELAGGQPIIGYQQASLTKNIQRAFRLQAVALWLLALLLGITAIALVAQSISRATWADARDNPVLSAVGMTRRQLFAAGVLRLGILSTGSAAIAVGLAFLLSPLAPVGRARDAVLDPGFAFDGAAMLVGSGAVVAVAVLSALIPSARAARVLAAGRGDGARPRSALVESALRRGVPPTGAVGLRFALERGSGPTAAPTRATMLSAVLALGAIAMTLVFGGSLNHLLGTPRLYGSTFEAMGRTGGVGVPREDAPRALAEIRAAPGVEAVAEANVGIPLRVNGELADTIAMDEESAGTFLPPLLAGRYPSADDEIMLGAGTMRAARARLGGEVEVGPLGSPSRTYRVVGVGVIPVVGHSGNLGEGAMVSIAGAGGFFQGDETVGGIVLRLRPGTDLDAVSEVVSRATGGLIGPLEQPFQPGDLVNFGGQRNLPFVLTSILALMAAATIVHALVSSIRRRRRDLAILKATGFTPGQVRLTVGWHATALVATGLAAGLPLGIVAGRALWTTYANTLGIVPAARAPVGWLLAAIPAALVVSALVSLVPAGRAARIQPAVALRTE